MLAAGRQITVQALGIVRRVDASLFDAALDDPEAFRAELTRLIEASRAP